AAEITPVRSVDRKTVGKGMPGPVTKALQKAFFGLFDGSTVDQWGWLTPVSAESTEQAARSEVHANSIEEEAA
ncbi:MAG: branched chain amino acid aminotransferase, partial [Arenimonas sp.]